MGWGGSVQAMINTLKANEALLRKRKMLFEQDRAFTKVKRRYVKASEGILQGPTATQADLKKIRERIIQDQKKKLVLTTCCAALLILLISVCLQLLFKNHASQHLKEWKVQQIDFHKQQLIQYNHNMKEGFEKMEAGNYFFAIGNFSEALEQIPKDSLAEYQLTYAYCLLCIMEQKGCSKAHSLVDKLIAKYPESIEYDLLRSNYLDNNSDS